MRHTRQPLTLLADTSAHEGPVYVAAEDALYYTTVPVERDAAGQPIVAIARLDLTSGAVSVVRQHANAANGMTLDHDGWLLVCEQGGPDRAAGIARVDRSSGRREPVVDAWRGLPLSSPNDVLVARDGAIWFTDPSYGHLQGFRPAPALPDRAYRYDRDTGALDVVDETFDKPNGLALSPDERTLYLGDSEASVVRVFDVVDGRRLASGRLFASIAPGFPDGIKVDERGLVYVSFAGGIQVFDPSGRRVRVIDLPGAVNFALTDDRLLICADDGIYAVPLDHSDHGTMPASGRAGSSSIARSSSTAA
jgi:gluconolactonase